MELLQVLRVCSDCGLKACALEDLDKFVMASAGKYGRQNLCKPCRQKRRQERKQNDDRYYLQILLDSIKTRCHNPKHHDYPYYGGRGITICQEWLGSSESFVEWALDNGFLRGLEIDRIDNGGEYSPDNCRWITHGQQMRNTRTAVTNWEKGTRICETCGTEKPLEGFHRNKSMSEGRVYICKPCWNEFDRQRYREGRRG